MRRIVLLFLYGEGSVGVQGDRIVPWYTDARLLPVFLRIREVSCVFLNNFSCP